MRFRCRRKSRCGSVATATDKANAPGRAKSLEGLRRRELELNEIHTGGALNVAKNESIAAAVAQLIASGAISVVAMAPAIAQTPSAGVTAPTGSQRTTDPDRGDRFQHSPHRYGNPEPGPGADGGGPGPLRLHDGQRGAARRHRQRPGPAEPGHSTARSRAVRAAWRCAVWVSARRWCWSTAGAWSGIRFRTTTRAISSTSPASRSRRSNGSKFCWTGRPRSTGRTRSAAWSTSS